MVENNIIVETSYDFSVAKKPAQPVLDIWCQEKEKIM